MLVKGATDSKVHGANMGPIWSWKDPGGPHNGPINFAVWYAKGYRYDDELTVSIFSVLVAFYFISPKYVICKKNTSLTRSELCF